VEIGSPITILIGRGRRKSRPLGMISNVLPTYTGTTGTWAAMASPNGAFLNGSSSPVRLRVPSGNNSADVPPRMISAARR